jgi:hypothetical protein
VCTRLCACLRDVIFRLTHTSDVLNLAQLFVVITAECIASENSDCHPKSNYHSQHFSPNLFHYDCDLCERGV